MSPGTLILRTATDLASDSMGGGETAGTAMAAATYYTLKSPDVYARLREEVRSAYRSLDEISIASATQIPYVVAVLKESMRIFPTVPHGTPRLSSGCTIDGHYVQAGVSFGEDKIDAYGSWLSLWAWMAPTVSPVTLYHPLKDPLIAR